MIQATVGGCVLVLRKWLVSSVAFSGIGSAEILPQLNVEERVYLNAARLGDTGILRQMINEDNEDAEILNFNCVDFMGRNGLHLAVDSDNLECVEILLEKLSFESIEESLLHAIDKRALNIVKVMIEHPTYLAGERHYQLLGKKDCFFRHEERQQFPPDVTPLILAAHKNDHEIIQMFLSRGYTIDRPHLIHCQCHDCLVKQNYDSLKLSRSRLNAYKALASPAVMALSSVDPITTTFELRQELMQVASVEKEFKKEYLRLVEQCMNFACELMDLCRGTQEMEAVVTEQTKYAIDPLAKFKLAIQYDEKKFVAHPNCQQHLTSIWYGKEMSFLQGLSTMKKIGYAALVLPVLPFICVVYIINPEAKVSKMMRCPVGKFITHTLSNFVFLFLLAVATFGLDEETEHRMENSNYTLDEDLRPSRHSFTNVQICIIFWIIGLLWIECKQIYYSGAKEHFMQYCNYMDFAILALYLASYGLRFIAEYHVRVAENYFAATYDMKTANASIFYSLVHRYVHRKEVGSAVESTEEEEFKIAKYAYFMLSSRFDWERDDPAIVAEVLFAIANVMSFARMTYHMPAHEMLGPLQISFGRMIGDITRFVVLFSLVILAFMVGLTNLYRYYGYQIIDSAKKTTATETFKGLSDTVFTLYFSMFGLISLDRLNIKTPRGKSGTDSIAMVSQVGVFMFAVYQVMVTIVLVNMLIAMMSHSFEAIQGDCDVEWKFARTKLWMNYIEEGGTLPVPFNMIPTPKSFRYCWQNIREICKCDDIVDEPVDYDFSRRRENVTVEIPSMICESEKTTYCYADIMQRLVRRYLFKLEREREVDIGGNAASEEMVEEEDTESLSSSRRESLQVIDEDTKEDRYQKRLESVKPPKPPKSSMRVSIKRHPRRRPSVEGPAAEKLEAIHRAQRVLDARLQDLQTTNRGERDIKENLDHIRHLMTENQKAMSALVNAMSSIQDEIRIFSKDQPLRRAQEQPAKTKQGAADGNSTRTSGAIAGLRKSLRRKRSGESNV